jgi:hypothetical protein
MKPLWFLTYKTLWNGVVRALSSPRRLIGLLFFTGYYFLVFIRPAMMPSREMRLPSRMEGAFEFPPMQVIEALSFGILAVLSLFMMLNVMAQQAGFKPADVDVLFPTPIKPKTVLLFRMLRDYLLTLLLPFVIILIGLRPAKLGWEAVFRNFPESNYAAMTFWALALSWFLMSMCWVAITYAISLFINRSDKRSTRNKRILGWTVALLTISTVGYIALESRRLEDLQDLLHLSESPWLRIVFFTATLASQVTLAPLTGDLASGALAMGAMIGIVAGALWVAMSQAGWMYDQAAVKGFESSSVRAAQRRGDTMGALAEMARKGKIRAGRQTFLHRLRMSGAKALLWKELFLQTRGFLGMLIVLGLMGIALCLMPALVPMGRTERGVPAFFFLMQASALFMMTLAIAQTGFIEVLRRVDLQKPLPFAPPIIVFSEIFAKAVLGIVVAVLASVVSAIVNPALLPYAFAAVIYSPALAILLSSTMFLVTILFPDFEDPTQRQFRGLMMLLALAILGLPPTGVFIGMWAIGLPAWLAALAGALICLGISGVSWVVSGKLYESYNPSE